MKNNNLCSPKENMKEIISVSKMNKSEIQLLIIFKTSKPKSHYSRTVTRHSYLPPGVTINLMYNHWKNKMIKNNQKSSIQYVLFTIKFNLGYGRLQQDVCFWLYNVNFVLFLIIQL